VLRIRDNEATVKRLEFSEDTINKLQKLASAVTEDIKELGIKKLTDGFSARCVCGSIPT
jgi:hypothetical protein